jgi:hypothetical protein
MMNEFLKSTSTEHIPWSYDATRAIGRKSARLKGLKDKITAEKQKLLNSFYERKNRMKTGFARSVGLPSEYGETSFQEAFAESFAEIIHGKPDAISEFGKEVRNFMDEVIPLWRID